MVTGGAGFIGSSLIRKLVGQGHEVRNLDLLTYAADPRALDSLEKHPRYSFSQCDICDQQKIKEELNSFKPDRLFHLAAETHVDRSIVEPTPFVMSNIVGTHSLLNECLKQLNDGTLNNSFRFIHVSTDEVYGSLEFDGPEFSEDSPYRPNSPYAATKASSDLLARSYFKTYAFPVIITHSSNNFGPFQNPEKLIPRMIKSCLHSESLPIYGDGQNLRDWIYVEDHVDALIEISENGKNGQVYNIGSGVEKSNIELVKGLCSLMDKLKPRSGGINYSNLIHFVDDRLGHDFRYALNTAKVNQELGWRPRWSFEQALELTVKAQLESSL